MELTQLPERMFAAGEEPIGERVNSYHKPKRIESILDALEPDEVEFMRNTPFGKIISQAENPSFSGSFGQFVIVRMLRVMKKYELWFLFAGKPIRMSLHEFAHVTGLNCRKLPKKNIRRKKNPINEKLYWGELFGSLKFCTVDTAIEMLKKRIVKDREMRLKYACLAFTASVLLPTSHSPRIITEHVEMIRDMDEFLKYPWGRVSFEMLVTGIKKKDELSLAQPSVALPGFVDAIQLVFIAAVPQIKEVVTLPEPVVVINSDTDSDFEDIESEVAQPCMTEPPRLTPVSARYSVNPAHVRDMDEECKVDVNSMVVDATHTPEELTWEDEVDDTSVDKLAAAIDQGNALKKSMFIGGLSTADLACMRAEKERENPDKKKHKEKEGKDKKGRENPADSPEGDIGEAYDVSHIADLVGRIVTPKIEDVVFKAGDKLEERLAKLIKTEVQNMQGAVVQSIIGLLGKPNSNVDVNISSVGDVNISSVGEAQNSNGAPGLNTPASLPSGLHNSNEQPRVQAATFLPQQPEKVLESQHVEKLINTVISDVVGVLDENEVSPEDNQTPILTTLESGAEGDSTKEDTAGPPTETDFTTPLPGKNTKFTQHHLSPVDEEGSPCETEDELLLEKEFLPTVPDAVVNNEMGETRKSKRTRILPPLFNDYQCDPKITAFRVDGTLSSTADNIDEIYIAMRERAGHSKVYTVGRSISVTTDELNVIVDRNHQMTPKAMDVFMYYISLDRNRKGSHQSKIAFYDTNFPALLMRQYARLTKTAIKDRQRLKYDEAVAKFFISSSTLHDVYDRIYFPFFIDKQHWVGVCLDLACRAVQVLDCNHGFRTECMMKKDLNPIAVVIPHILATASGNSSADARQPYQMVRVTGVPHNSNSTDAAATTILLIQAHASNSGDGCKDVTPETLASGAKHLAVLVYRDIIPV